MSNVIVVLGPGQIGQAIARRVGVGKQVLLADMREENATAAAEVLGNAGYQVSVATIDVSSREAVHALAGTATGLGGVVGLIHAAGVSPSQASPSMILNVDLYGTALVLEEFGNVIAPAGAGVVIASQSGHRLPALTVEQNQALATTPAQELLDLNRDNGTDRPAGATQCRPRRRGSQGYDVRAELSGRSSRRRSPRTPRPVPASAPSEARSAARARRGA